MQPPAPTRIATLGVTTFFSLGLLVAAAAAQTCTEEAGAEEAQTYVDQCLEVSPATRPPCNAENACQLIVDEIVRGCDMLGEDAPEFCGDYAD